MRSFSQFIAEVRAYHGTDRAFTSFNTNAGGENGSTGAKNGVLGAFFTTDYNKAAALYAGRRGRVIEAELTMAHPKVLRGLEYDNDASAAVNQACADYHDKRWDDLTEQDFHTYREFLQRSGFDGIIVKLYDGATDYIVFNGSAIHIVEEDA